MKLYSRWQKSAGERVRIACNLKGLSYEYVPVSSMPQGAYKLLNPQGLLPALEVDGRVIAQSSAILDFLEERYPERPLLPRDDILRAHGELLAAKWLSHWLTLGLGALEDTLEQRTGKWPFCFGDTPGWAEVHLIPQLSNARRLQVDVTAYRRLLEVERRCIDLDAFSQARPENQPDFPRT